MDSLQTSAKIPDWIKIVMVFIDRIGFPILAFLLMFFFSTVTIRENTKILQELKNVIEKVNLERGAK